MLLDCCALLVEVFVDGLGLSDFVVCLGFDEVVELLFVDDPPVVLAVVAVDFLLLLVLVGGQPAVELPLHSLDFVLLQLIPNYNKLWVTLVLVDHAFALAMRPDCLDGLLLSVEDDVAGRVVDPLYLEMWVGAEVVPYFLVAHVVHSEQVPRVLPYGHVVLREVGIVFLCEEL